jgi:hypothetical protein
MAAGAGVDRHAQILARDNADTFSAVVTAIAAILALA